MPAHYALLYYTKPGGPITFNYFAKTADDNNILSPLDADHYCLNSDCIRKRKEIGDDDKIELNDIWWNIHRIKHKKYRDQHPCQLPVKLLERVIKLSTNVADIVFDPFCGAGTTAIAAKSTRRHYVALDIDEKYVEIARHNLQRMQLTSTGEYHILRESQAQKRTQITKKEVEIGYIELCRHNGTVVELEELAQLDPSLYKKISALDYSFGALKKMARRRLEIQSTR